MKKILWRCPDCIKNRDDEDAFKSEKVRVRTCSEYAIKTHMTLLSTQREAIRSQVLLKISWAMTLLF